LDRRVQPLREVVDRLEDLLLPSWDGVPLDGKGAENQQAKRDHQPNAVSPSVGMS
jgi:hypothetical protein